MNQKINRNDPCSCGSGKKYKQCCQLTDATPSPAAKNRLLESVPDLFKQALKHQLANQLEQAEALYQQILAISPKHLDSLTNLGLLFVKTDRRDMGKSLLQKAVHIEPSAKHYSNLSIVLPAMDAMDCMKKAINLNPGEAMYYKNMGGLFFGEARYEEAILYYKKALALNPTYDEVISDIGSCLMQQSQFQEAASYYRRAIALNPQAEVSHKRLLFCLCFDKQAFPDTYLKEAKRLDAVWQAAATTPYKKWHCIAPSTQQPLRVGLVSGDIGNHPVGFFLESMIEHIDKSQIEFFVYSTRPVIREDALTFRVQPHCKQWLSIRSLTDQQAAAQIHHDGVHILIDLAGYTNHTGLSIFAWRPAPVQVSWLGYFASTGLSFIDYFIADPISVPVQNQYYFTEQVRYLPHTRLCFSPPAADIAQELSLLPALKNGYVTFGCFQNLSKLNDTMLQQWATILQRCPNSKLLIKNRQTEDVCVKADLIDRLTELGFDIKRVLLEGASPRQEYLASYAKVDFMLDTFPFPGGTTTCEALWMGVPTLTLAGNTLLERQGMSMLSCVGLNDWVAETTEDYVNKAVSFAHNLEQLSQLRATLRHTMSQSPLVDAVQFSRDFTQLLLTLWHEKQNT